MQDLSKNIPDSIPVNRRFGFNDTVLECIEGKSCGGCYFDEKSKYENLHICDKCTARDRLDNKDVVFKKVDPDLISVGTTIEHEGVIYECVEDKTRSCAGCAFLKNELQCSLNNYVFGNCIKRSMSNRPVKFIKKEMKEDIPNRKIGETFTYNGESYQCVEGHFRCDLCCFSEKSRIECKKPNDFGFCSPGQRHDRKSVFFLKIPNEVIPLSKDAPVGSIVEYNKKLYKVVESKRCHGCFFYKEKLDCPGSIDNCPCSEEHRIDGKGVIFVRCDGVGCIREQAVKEKKTYFKVDEVFQVGLVQVKCVKSDQSCKGCYFFNEDNPYDSCPTHILGDCVAKKRPDDTEVKFIKIDE